jgi:phytoene dehydrogenase-like protein
VQGGSQRLSSALARAIKVAGGEVLVRRVVTRVALDRRAAPAAITHTARDGSDPKPSKRADRQQRRARRRSRR